MKAKLINISLTEANGLVYATSENLPGLYVSGNDQPSVLAEVPDAIRAMFLADGIKVIVSEVEGDESPMPPPWVAVPMETAA